MLEKIVQAIAVQEGWHLVGNPLPRRNNNPGNLKFGPRARRFGAQKKDKQGHAIFPTPEDGWDALRSLIKTKDGQTLRHIGKTYAEDPNWARGVSMISGVGLDDPLNFGESPRKVVMSKSRYPAWLEMAMQEIGVKETPGQKSNPVVVQYYKDAGTGPMPDSVPWCAAFIGAMLTRCGFKPSGSLMARSYLNWGAHLGVPRPGAVVVFSRGTPPSGHVAFFLKDQGYSIQVVGGNQSDAVTVTSYPKRRVLGYRWPKEDQPMAKAMKRTSKRKSFKHELRYGAPGAGGIEDMPPSLVTDVPVVNPNTTSTNVVGIGAVITPMILWLLQYFEIPLTVNDIALLTSAGSVLVGVFMFIKNRYFTAEATTTTAVAKGLKIRME